ncbi:hypothetical protein [Silvimonas iriomotensis]|uniref:Uncharacterized protein n=1 Tax=Silvimonas iriomotensis TaxID=449662 RepID=A0ABQ2P6C9_9NEIS|nr:hypothetical protein [Silvimonas iriomotensis]GGP18794.1 hypothetical protein GCM10010970_07290 [Silvimonas iriomotensis]
MDSHVAQSSILDIIAGTLAPVLPVQSGLQGRCAESVGGDLYVFITTPRHAAAPQEMKYDLNLAFVIAEKGWSAFKAQSDQAQQHLLQTFEQTIRGRLAEAFEYWKSNVDFSVSAQSEPGRITFIRFEDFGQQAGEGGAGQT